jgi:hypothetical protein
LPPPLLPNAILRRVIRLPDSYTLESREWRDERRVAASAPAGATLVVCISDKDKDKEWDQSSDGQGEQRDPSDAISRLISRPSLGRPSTGQPLAGRQSMQVRYQPRNNNAPFPCPCRDTPRSHTTRRAAFLNKDSL